MNNIEQYTIVINCVFEGARVCWKCCCNAKPLVGMQGYSHRNIPQPCLSTILALQQLLAFGSGRLRCRCGDGTTFNQIKNYMEFCCWTFCEIFLLACLVTFLWKLFACCKSAEWCQILPGSCMKNPCYLVRRGWNILGLRPCNGD